MNQRSILPTIMAAGRPQISIDESMVRCSHRLPPLSIAHALGLGCADGYSCQKGVWMLSARVPAEPGSTHSSEPGRILKTGRLRAVSMSRAATISAPGAGSSRMWFKLSCKGDEFDIADGRSHVNGGLLISS
jgi:hypothetical protein